MSVSGFVAVPSNVTTSGIATQLKRSRVRDVSNTLVGSKHLYAKPAKCVFFFVFFFLFFLFIYCNNDAKDKRGIVRLEQLIRTSSVNDTKRGSKLYDITPYNALR